MFGLCSQIDLIDASGINITRNDAFSFFSNKSRIISSIAAEIRKGAFAFKRLQSTLYKIPLFNESLSVYVFFCV